MMADRYGLLPTRAALRSKDDELELTAGSATRRSTCWCATT
jgi:hypothetical protein